MSDKPFHAIAGYRHFAQLTNWVVAVLSLTFAILTPLTYFTLQWEYHRGVMEVEASNLSYRVSRLISEYPDSWTFRQDVISEIFGQVEWRHTAAPVTLEVTAQGRVVARGRAEPPPRGFGWISNRITRPVYDNGLAVGQVEVGMSVLHCLRFTFPIAISAAITSLVAFFVIRHLVMRVVGSAFAEISHAASHDTLTGLPNRAVLNDRLALAVDTARRREEAVATLFLDLDHFKDVNDVLGHAVGDELLRRVSGRLKACIRKSDTLARLGGDEFAIVQCGAEQPSGAVHAAQRILDSLEVPFEINGQKVRTGMTIGISLFPTDGKTPTQLLQNADLALYRAKSAERGTYRFFEAEMDGALRRRKELGERLRLALEQEGLELRYQLQMEPGGRKATGVEALARWTDSKFGQVSPEEFVPIAEDTGLISGMTEWIMRRACLDAHAWADLTLAVNISAASIRGEELPGLVSGILAETGFDPARLELEVTESMLIQDSEQAFEILTAIKALGARVAMDDFGTGYSSLSYLLRFPFDKVKIDRSFVAVLGKDRQADAIVAAAIMLCRQLDMRTLAEGVETAEQADLLAGLGCDEMQGFLYSRPVTAAQVSGALEELASRAQAAAKGDGPRRRPAIQAVV